MSTMGMVMVGLAFLGTVLVALSLWRNPVLRRISLRNLNLFVKTPRQPGARWG